jgi:feruloyl esterase
MEDTRVGRKSRRRLDPDLAAAVVAVGAILGASGSAWASGMACGELLGLKLPQTEVTSAEVVRKGGFQWPATSQVPRGFELDPASLPEFCRVAATLTPSKDSDIKMELWLPTSDWNGKYHTVANGGWGGSIQYRGLIETVQRGYATASTDTGHTEPGGSWAIGHPEKVRDYGGRAIHETTAKAKAIATAFYGKAPAASLMTGCSLGGLQALRAIQDYPGDFDAVVAGSPHFNMTRHNAAQIWASWLLARDPEKLVSKEKLASVHKVVLEQCDGSDGLKDGIVDDPLTCGFKPSSLICQGDERPDCLTRKQAEFLQQVYSGPVYQSTGESINPGPLVGNESTWSFSIPPKPPGVAVDLFRYLVFEDPAWDFPKLDYDKDIVLTEKKVAPIINAENPDLSAFFNRGGKLMMYIGSYEHTNYTAHLGYVEKVRKTVGAAKTDESVRVFIVPGMYHCAGGIGADTFDKLGAIERWQETGKPPDVIEAAQVRDGKVVFTRPLCAHPKTARYNGSGDPSKAESFSCK